MSMLTPLFGLDDINAMRASEQVRPEEIELMRDKSLLISATDLALRSAYSHGLDLPVGAVTAVEDWVNGRYFASDRRAGYKQMHAEYMAVQDASLNVWGREPDTVVVTIEPCDNCQDFLSTVRSLKRVGFAIPRHEIAEMGLVKPHKETIFERAKRVGLPYEVVQIQDPFWQNVGRVILGSVTRDPVSEVLEVDVEKLDRDLQALEAA